MAYNATVRRHDHDGNLISVFTAEVNDAGRMLRSNAVQCTGLEGSERYDAYVRAVAFNGYDLRITRDQCAGYKAFLFGSAR